MLKKNLLYVTSLIVTVLFIVTVIYITCVLSKVDLSEDKKNVQISKKFNKNRNFENKIRLRYLKIKAEK